MVKRQWLENLRTQQGLTQQEVADKAGIARAYYSAIETGNRRGSVGVVMKIAQVLGFKWTIFFANECSELEQVKEAM